MNNRIPVTIPLEPYLYKYIHDELKSTDGEVLISANSDIGSWLMPMLSTSSKPMAKPANEYHITILVPCRDELGKTYDARTKFLVMEPANIARVNKMFRYMMYKDIINRLQWIHERGEGKRKGGKMKQEIEDFIQKYSTKGAELTYDRFKKAYERHRNSPESLIQQLF